MAAHVFTELTANEVKLLTKYDPALVKEKLAEKLDISLSKAISGGSYAVAHVVVGVQPVDAETVTIGADVYEYDDNAVVGAGHIAVLIGADVAATRLNLIAAINTSSTESVVALAGAALSNSVEVLVADKPHGTPFPTGASITLAETMGNAGNYWTQTTLGSAGYPVKKQFAVDYITMNATNLAHSFVFAFPFTVTTFQYQAFTSAGTLKPNTATLVISSGQIVVTPAAGGTPLVSGDVVHILAFA